jgi:phosphatidate cytidylyltransferase
MVPLVVYGVLNLSTEMFALLLGIVLLAGAWEWSRLIPLQGLPARLAFTVVVAGLMGLLWQAGLAQFITPLLLAGLAWWLVALFWLSRPQLGRQPSLLSVNLKMLAGLLVIIPAWVALAGLHAHSSGGGPKLVLILLVMVWLADSGAYFAGRQWGRTKLAPVVSPGKTWEGVFGGLLASLVFAALAAGLYSGSLEWTLTFMLVSLMAVLFSVAGDLLESLMKRQSGIKDSGTIIPGHGGVLDRIDSMLAAAPVFLIGFQWLGL